MVTPLQKCYDEISILKEELKKRDEQIEKLIENNINLNKKVESLLSKTPFYQKGGPSRSKVAKLVENYEKNIAKPIPKPRTIKTTPIPKPIPAPRAKVAKLVENYEKNIAKPIPKPRTIKTTPIPAPRTKVTPIVKEIPIPSDNMFIDEEKPEII